MRFHKKTDHRWKFCTDVILFSENLRRNEIYVHVNDIIWPSSINTCNSFTKIIAFK